MRSIAKAQVIACDGDGIAERHYSMWYSLRFRSAGDFARFAWLRRAGSKLGRAASSDRGWLKWAWLSARSHTCATTSFGEEVL